MELSSHDFAGRVSFVTGPEKGCGKTTFVNRALALLRAAGERAAFLTVGFEGEAGPGSPPGGAGRRPTIDCLPGEVFLSSELYLRGSTCSPEILDLLPGSTALGRLALARARRRGQVVLVGPERNDYAAWAIDRVLEEGWARSVLVDGAINRITQVSARSDARLFYVARIGPGDLDRQLRSLRRMFTLARLPLWPAGRDPAGAEHGFPAPVAALEGPLTAETLSRLPPAAKTILVDDFTKVFLEASALAALLRSRSIVVRRRLWLSAFVVALRDLSRARFLDALGDRDLQSLVAFNPYEARAGEYAHA